MARQIWVSSESGGLFAGRVIGVGPKGGCGALEFPGLRVESLPEDVMDASPYRTGSGALLERVPA